MENVMESPCMDFAKLPCPAGMAAVFRLPWRTGREIAQRMADA